MNAISAAPPVTPAAPPVIGLREVGQTFYDPKRRRPVRVLGGINLEVQAGEIICVVGPSGCGKSTLLNGIGGFRPFTEGDARLDGRPITGPGKDRGVVFQDYPVPEFLSALDNVALGLNLDRLPLWQNLLPAFTRRRREHLAEAGEYLAQVGLSEHAHKFPHELSGGQRQRVAIAQALAMRPRVLLMDEPFSGLDPRSRESLQLTVLRIHEQLRNTIFFVTHDLEEAVFVGNRIIVLSQHAGEGDAPGEGATIVHERDLAAYKDPEVKKTPEFAALLRDLRGTFGDAHFDRRAAKHHAPFTLLVKSK